jgi:hypothetical protein
VCGLDIFCCAVRWDDQCVTYAQNQCAGPCPCAPASIAGTIRYYANGEPVAGVTVMDGNPAATDAAGDYTLTGFPAGTLRIEPFKQGGRNQGISSLDAARVRQDAVGMLSLTERQRLACDVTGDGTISSLDAARIRQLLVGIIAQLPIAVLCGSEWAFVPMPQQAGGQTAAPMVGGGACTPGAIQFASPSGTITGQDFEAVLFGDCTGNWLP